MQGEAVPTRSIPNLGFDFSSFGLMAEKQFQLELVLSCIAHTYPGLQKDQRHRKYGLPFTDIYIYISLSVLHTFSYSNTCNP